MNYFKKPIDEITEADLQSLIDNEVCESKTVEYKRDISLTSRDDKKEFLADVSSFANSVGGTIFFGIEEGNGEDKGKPIAIVGLENGSSDELKQKVENILRDNLDPRIHGIDIGAVNLEDEKYVLVIQIRKSFRSPHMVKSSFKFFSRNSAGKYPLDVTELRSAFVQSESVYEKAKEFRINRIEHHLSNDHVVPLPETGLILLQIIPFRAFEPSMRFDLTSDNEIRRRLVPFPNVEHSKIFNFNGIQTHWSRNDETNISTFTQLFNNGIIEVFDSVYLSTIFSENKEINIIPLENRILEKISLYLEIQKAIGVEPTIFIALSLLNVTGYKFHFERTRYLSHGNNKIKESELFFPEIILYNYDDDIGKAFKPIFDSLWNAVGFPKSWNYNEEGEWESYVDQEKRKRVFGS